MKDKIFEKISKMAKASGIFASNKESFVFQIVILLSLLEIFNHDDYGDLYRIAGILYGNSFVNCNDSFDNEWGVKVANYALEMINKKCLNLQ